jgi:uncharacterized protein with HEPN domain
MNRDLSYLLDIAETCSTIIELIQEMDQASFVSDKRTHLAVLYEITITGEIVKRLSLEFRQQYPEIPWKQIAGMRDKLVHDYNRVDLDLTWEVTQSSIPKFFNVRQFKYEVQQVLMMTARILHSECDSQAIFLVDY